MNLRTVVEFDDTLCFHLTDIYRGKFLSQQWLQLTAIFFSWSCTNMGDRFLRRTVRQDRRAIFEHSAPQSTDDCINVTGKSLITLPRTRPNFLPWITYANTDILHASGTEVLCCHADLVSYSATTRYVIPEYGEEEIFRLRPR